MADHPELRASDADREKVVDQLRRHLADGRLDLTEFEERAEQAYAARRLGELEPLLADLPRIRAGGPPARVHPRDGRSARRRLGHDVAWVPEVSEYLRWWIPLSLMFVLIWALSGGGYFWPMWPMFGTGVPMLFMFVARK